MKVKYYELDEEEQAILEAYEKGELRSVPNVEQVKRELISAAKNTLKKTKNINLRVSEKTLMKLKAKAAHEGIPYQTLASSILHKYSNE